MLDKVPEILSTIRERLRSPFIGSFAIAFIIANWRVFVALFWFKPEMLEAAGSKNHVDYIVAVTNIYTVLWIPLAVAFFFTFIWPFLRNWIDLFTAMRSVAAQKMQEPVVKRGSISVEAYLGLSEALQKEQKSLDSALKRAQHVEERLLEKESEIAEMQTENEKLKMKYDPSLLNGTWLRKVESSSLNSESYELTMLEIKNSWAMAKSNTGKQIYGVRIEYFELDTEAIQTSIKMRYKVSANKELGREHTYYYHFDLLAHNDFTLIRGEEKHYGEGGEVVHFEIVLTKVAGEKEISE